MQVLSRLEIEKKLSLLKNWELKESNLYRKVCFDNYLQAIDFVNKVAQLAEEQNHHPLLLIDYTTVKIKLSTHDAGGITLKDFELALTIVKTRL